MSRRPTRHGLRWALAFLRFQRRGFGICYAPARCRGMEMWDAMDMAEEILEARGRARHAVLRITIGRAREFLDARDRRYAAAWLEARKGEGVERG